MMEATTTEEDITGTALIKQTIMEYIKQQENIGELVTSQDIHEAVVEAFGDYDKATLSSLLWTMGQQGLIKSTKLEHPTKNAKCTYSSVAMAPTDRVVSKKVRFSKKNIPAETGTEIPIDVRANQDGSITIKYAGMRLTFSKE